MEGCKPEEHTVVCSSYFQLEDMMASSSRCTVQQGAAPIVDVRVCRVCFATDCKLYSMITYKVLYKLYETLTGLLLKNKDNLPPYMCCECACQLLNCHRFRTASLRAHLTLLEIINNHSYVSLELIQPFKSLQHSLNLIQTHCDNQIDYDLDVELAKEESIYINKQPPINLPGLAEPIGISNIKAENIDIINQDILNTEDETNVDMVCISSLPENIANKDNVKTENYGSFKQDILKADNTGNFDIFSSLEKIAEKGIKEEYVDVINQNVCNAEETENKVIDHIFDSFKKIGKDSVKPENVEINQDICNFNDSENNDTLCIYVELEDNTVKDIYEEKSDELNKDVLNLHHRKNDVVGMTNLSKNMPNDSINIKSDCLIHRKSADEDGRITNVEHGKEFLSEADSRLATEMKQKINQSTIRNEQAPKEREDLQEAKVDVLQNLEADGILSVDNKFSCNLCSYQTVSEIRLSSHLKAHAAAEYYSCNMCSYITIYRHSLSCHLTTHSDVKPFSCNVCNKAFDEEKDLTAHISTHSGKKSFSCYICQKFFHQKSYLARHLRTHSNKKMFSCNICHKVFNQKHNLTTHLRIHSGERPFSCDICNKAFNQKNILTRHYKTHFGEQPFLCDICNKAFDKKINLTTHLSTHSIDM